MLVTMLIKSKKVEILPSIQRTPMSIFYCVQPSLDSAKRQLAYGWP